MVDLSNGSSRVSSTMRRSLTLCEALFFLSSSWLHHSQWCMSKPLSNLEEKKCNLRYLMVNCGRKRLGKRQFTRDMFLWGLFLRLNLLHGN